MNSKIVAFIEKDIESGSYVAFVPGIPGAHTQADTKALPEFVGVQQIEVAI